MECLLLLTTSSRKTILLFWSHFVSWSWCYIWNADHPVVYCIGARSPFLGFVSGQENKVKVSGSRCKVCSHWLSSWQDTDTTEAYAAGCLAILLSGISLHSEGNTVVALPFYYQESAHKVKVALPFYYQELITTAKAIQWSSCHSIIRNQSPKGRNNIGCHFIIRNPVITVKAIQWQSFSGSEGVFLEHN